MEIILRGKVRGGKKRGKQLGFPTANIKLHKQISEGVYIGQVVLLEKNYQAAVFIGSAKTYNELDYKAEIYLLDFKQEIYGQWLTVKLLKKLRGNKKFLSEEELRKQITEDVKQTRDYFKKI